MVGGQATDADDRIIYNQGSGAVLFDADGVGGAEAVIVAMIQPGLNLTATDFMII